MIYNIYVVIYAPHGNQKQQPEIDTHKHSKKESRRNARVIRSQGKRAKEEEGI